GNRSDFIAASAGTGSSGMAINSELIHIYVKNYQVFTQLIQIKHLLILDLKRQVPIIFIR
ncbi:MAG: hypothetical protein ACMG55_19000, partial [Microcoleus sp.]